MKTLEAISDVVDRALEAERMVELEQTNEELELECRELHDKLRTAENDILNLLDELDGVREAAAQREANLEGVIARLDDELSDAHDVILDIQRRLREMEK